MCIFEVLIFALSTICAAQNATEAITAPTALPPMSIITPSLLMDPPGGQIYTGEKAVLHCSAEGSSPDWTYQWFHNDQQTILDSSDPNSSSYTINPAAPALSGKYWCKIKRAEQLTMFSSMSELVVVDPPKPSLEHQWLDVFPTERVNMSCGIRDSSDWTYSWYRNETDLKTISETYMFSVTKANFGNYFCRAKHKTKPDVITDSRSISFKVYENKPQMMITQTPDFDQMYIGESITFTCRVTQSSGWEYVWFKNDVEVGKGENLMIKNPQISDNGVYWCRARRGKGQMITVKSEKKSVHFSAPPKPSLELQTHWSDVFPGEQVELSCRIQGSSDWTYKWSRNEPNLQTASIVSPDSERSTLTILSAAQIHQGLYFCTGHHKTRSVISDPSQSINIGVYTNQPKPSLRKHPEFKEIYVGEPVTFSCAVHDSSGWEYQWYKDGHQLPTSDTSNTNNNIISSPAPSDGGTYKCRAKRGKEPFYSDDSDTLVLHIIDKPVPSLELQTSWLDVFPAERVEFRCAIQDSSDWTYKWYRDGQELTKAPNMLLSDKGSYLTILSAKQEHAGGYTCAAQHNSRPVNSKPNNTLKLIVHANKPKPLITQDPSVQRMYVGEPVSFKCNVEVSTGWDYHWFKNKTMLVNNNNSGIDIENVTSSNSGTYYCVAKRGKTIYQTGFSDAMTLHVYAVPIPKLGLQTKWPDVFPTERVEMRCGVQGSTEWIYRWYKDGNMIPDTQTRPDGAAYFISSASHTNTGQYICEGQHKIRTFSTKPSYSLDLNVYNEIPKPMLTQEPGFEAMYIAERVTFSCEVNISTGWQYLWFKDGVVLPVSENRYHIVSALESNTGKYQCQATRGQGTKFLTKPTEALHLGIHVRPLAVVTLLTGWSEVFSTDSLILSCEVQGSQDLWNYTWFKEGKEIPLTKSNRHTVTPENDPNQNEYTCQGIRTSRPLFSSPSVSYKTKNLLLKRRVLLSISGCLFFGIIAVFIGCIVLRITRKPVEEAPAEEPNLFLTMAELKARSDCEPSPLAEYITEAMLTPSIKDADEIVKICNESTPLQITLQEDQVSPESLGTAENNGGLMSFK